MDKQTELKVLLCDKFLLIENLQARANQVNSEIREIKQLLAKEMSQEVSKGVTSVKQTGGITAKTVNTKPEVKKKSD